MLDDQKQWKGHSAPGLAGAIWFFGWLLTIGFAKLVWWQIIVGVVIWPFSLGTTLG